MESSRSTGRFLLGKQSSMAPERENEPATVEEVPEGVESRIRLMYLANEGDLKGIEELFDAGVDVNFRDIDDRTALHVAACQGRKDVVELLLRKGAEVDPKDRWGSTPLSDAIYYKNHDVIKLLEEHGAKPLVAPMHVLHSREVPEYEIDPSELDFTNSLDITKGTFRTAFWRGIQVAVKKLNLDVITDEDTVRAFRDELALLQKIRHPNVVQFLGAVTQSSPMMIVTEYLPKGDFRLFLKRKGQLKPPLAVKFALDIARGMNYLHENKPEAIIHRDLEPSNILRDDSGHLKVADFGLSKLLRVAKTVKEVRPLTCLDNSCRYISPEVFRNEEYDTKVDVFSFALILQEDSEMLKSIKCMPAVVKNESEPIFLAFRLHIPLYSWIAILPLSFYLQMIEGSPPFSTKPENEVPKAYADKDRPHFKASRKLYPYGLQELIEVCWDDNPAKRPTFRQIISRLSTIERNLVRKRHWKTRTLPCLPSFEAIFKKGRSNPSSRDSSSRSSSL